MRYSIVINCYNTLALIKKSVDAAIASTDDNSELILVNNHPPYDDALIFLNSISHPRLRVLDPGRNLGCTNGFQYGAEHGVGKYIVKLDDDTIVPKSNWTLAMDQALKDFPDLAYVALGMPIYQIGKSPAINKPDYSLEFTKDIVLFSCMMIRKKLWEQHFKINETGLYGGEEMHFMKKAAALGMRKGYIVSHLCKHLGRTPESDPLYGAWKIFYGFKGSTRLDYPEWRKNFSLGQPEVELLKQVGYPDDQIAEIKHLLKNK